MPANPQAESPKLEPKILTYPGVYKNSNLLGPMIASCGAPACIYAVGLRAQGAGLRTLVFIQDEGRPRFRKQGQIPVRFAENLLG